MEPHHLLLGVLRAGDPRITALDVEQVRRAPIAPSGQPPGVAARHVLARAVHFARRDRAEHVEVEHLLRAIVEAMHGATLPNPWRRLLATLEARPAA